MTPQLQQAIRLLQLPVMELQAQLQDALEKNVMLEAEEETQDAAATAEQQVQDEAPPPVETNWDDMPVSSRPGPSSDDNRIQDLAPRGGESLFEHLLWQLQLENLSPTEFAIGQAIIDGVNDDGYLIDSVLNLCRSLEPELSVDEATAEAVLQRIQGFDPAGVGARSVSECLQLQLAQLDDDTPGLKLAGRLAAEHLELMAEQKYAALRRRLRVSEDELEQAIALVRSLHPRPGSSVHAGTTDYVVPDVYVRKIDGRWQIELNHASAPKLRVNKSYARLVTRQEDQTVLRAQLQEARWLVRSLEIRSETLLRVATAIVERQYEFLERGEEAMQPMVLRHVAEALEMHESTISRVTTNKFMHTPRGVFEFRYFFSSHVETADGGERSSIAIRAKIKKLINGENSGKPLSDNKIAQMLMQEGIQVARRTVAKYREAMAIPSSSERKRLSWR